MRLPQSLRSLAMTKLWVRTTGGQESGRNTKKDYSVDPRKDSAGKLPSG
jgi:hypothetical protein